MRSGYVGTEGDGIALRQCRLGIQRNGQTLRSHQPIVNVFPMRRMGDQLSGERFLCALIHLVHGNQQPLAMKPSTNPIDGLDFHDTMSLAWNR